MGLPEIVDFARNFAAMVRVQGPDPKGLKMRNHAFHLYNSGKSTLSASGILLPGSSANQINGGKDAQWLPGSALVVTVASIVEPFLSLQYRENMSQVEQSSTRRQTNMMGGESSNPHLMGRSTAKIALLGVCSTISEDLPNLNIARSNKRGDPLLAMGSLFGVLSPVHFFNSVSLGSVANCYPSGSAKRSLLMADIRCLPGMEGGPVFGEHGLLISVLTRPLRQRISGAVEVPKSNCTW